MMVLICDLRLASLRRWLLEWVRLSAWVFGQSGCIVCSKAFTHTWLAERDAKIQFSVTLFTLLIWSFETASVDIGRLPHHQVLVTVIRHLAIFSLLYSLNFCLTTVFVINTEFVLLVYMTHYGTAVRANIYACQMLTYGIMLVLEAMWTELLIFLCKAILALILDFIGNTWLIRSIKKLLRVLRMRNFFGTRR